MCTVSWLHQPDGYHLLCNRDEKHTRAPASGPRVSVRDGVRYLAPVDADHRGTWLAVNEYGLSICLLNGGPPHRPASRSRGLLVTELVHAENLDHAVGLVSSLDLTPYAPCRMLFLQPVRPAFLASWDGKHLAFLPYGDAHKPLTSSSVDPEPAHRDRIREFERRPRTTPADLWEFHRSHAACVHRADAGTVSFSWIVVRGREIRFCYRPLAPCQWSPAEQITIPRAA